MIKIADADALDFDWWQERDRASVVVYTDDSRNVEIWAAWDENVHELIEDGFIKWEDDDSVLDYLEHLGIVEFVEEEETQDEGSEDEQAEEED